MKTVTLMISEQVVVAAHAVYGLQQRVIEEGTEEDHLSLSEMNEIVKQLDDVAKRLVALDRKFTKGA